MNSEYEKQLEPEFEEFLKTVGNFLRKERESLGYSNADTFGNKIDIEGATIRSYENGKGRMTLQRFYTLIRGLNKAKEDIFKEVITNATSTPNTKDFRLTPTQEQEVRQHLISTLGKSQNPNLTSDNITRLYLMLLYCHNRKLKKSELKHQFGLGGKGYPNNFNMVLKLAIEAKWIAMTNPEGRRDRNQQYYTSEEGIKVLGFGRQVPL